ncbi:MAG: T9SS type A sorting domain-containing protein, partial [Bacteroidetes bacterium]|nr:T9SS type A sorting domain-containing protein [Bacteroidota bacterium]
CDSVTLSCPKPISLFSHTDSLLTVSFSDSSTGATSWLWDFGDGTGTSTAKDTTYTYATADTWWVTLTVTNPCGNNTYGDSVTVFLTGIGQSSIMKDQLKIYPNPANDKLNIEVQSTTASYIIIKIFNIQGKDIFTEITNKYSGEYILELDISKFSKGTYTVLAIIDDERIVKKIIID